MDYGVKMKKLKKRTGAVMLAVVMCVSGCLSGLGGITSVYAARSSKTSKTSNASKISNTSNTSNASKNEYSSQAFEDAYTYTEGDLGANWSKNRTEFKLWAPTADAVSVCLYQSGNAGANDRINEYTMKSGSKGVWNVSVNGDLNGIYYTYKVDVSNQRIEACDPYAKAVGVNGDRAMVINLDSTDPEGWDTDRNPQAGKDVTDAIIYELSIRDFSMDESSGVSKENRGKYLAFTEHNTRNATGQTTGVDYLKNLGITHVQLLPFQDFGYLEETSADAGYNWGYCTKNYYVPEGSYSRNPYDGAVRIKETKQMIQSLHENGMGVVMDVVYNHVYDASDFCFNRIVPNYFTRISDSGVYSNGSYCGNDTASERSMVKNYIVDSVLYWTKEYHIDGFRFDLAGILDTETINEIVKEVRAVEPSVLLYGEGWTMPTVSTKSGTVFATQQNAAKTKGFGYFDDGIRGRIKGGANDNSGGYVTSGTGAADIEKSLLGNTYWTTDPTQIVNYVSCHDDLCLWDKLNLAKKTETREQLIKENKLASAIVLASQGTAFIHAGEELLRSKKDEAGSVIENSYQSSDYVNRIKWSDLGSAEIQDISSYYKGLIAFRNAHKALRMTNEADIISSLSIRERVGNVVSIEIDASKVEGETVQKILIVLNPEKSTMSVPLPDGEWSVCVNGQKAGTETIATVNGTLSLDPISAYMLVQGKSQSAESGKVTVYYKSNDEVNYMLYGVNGNWNSVLMEYSDYKGYKSVSIPTGGAADVQVCFNDGADSWDNNGGNNYGFSPDGVYTIADGKVTGGNPDQAKNQNEVTVYYKSADEVNYMLYGLNGNWNSVQMERTECDEYKVVTIPTGDAANVQVCFNDGKDNWDNNQSKNYEFSANGVYTIADGKILGGNPEIVKQQNQVTVYYKAADAVNYMLYGLDGDWNSVLMANSEYGGYKVVTIPTGEASNVQVCFNDGGNNWDNHGGNNYSLGLNGVYTIADGKTAEGTPW